MSSGGTISGTGQAQSAGTLRVISSERVMQTFVVTKNEIRTLTLMNFAVAALFSIGSACFGYWLDIQTEIAIMEKVPASAHVVQAIVSPVAITLAIVFWLLGAGTWIFRGGFVTTIENETVVKS
jgi:hypothetical protein